MDLREQLLTAIKGDVLSFTAAVQVASRKMERLAKQIVRGQKNAAKRTKRK